jgi:hypothetical protein
MRGNRPITETHFVLMDDTFNGLFESRMGAAFLSKLKRGDGRAGGTRARQVGLKDQIAVRPSGAGGNERWWDWNIT